MAKPFKEGKTWAYRLRIRGEDIYDGGFLTEASAKKAEAEKKVELRNAEYAPGKSPYNTSVAAAYILYAKQRLPYHSVCKLRHSVCSSGVDSGCRFSLSMAILVASLLSIASVLAHKEMQA